MQKSFEEQLGLTLDKIDSISDTSSISSINESPTF